MRRCSASSRILGRWSAQGVRIRCDIHAPRRARIVQVMTHLKGESRLLAVVAWALAVSVHGPQASPVARPTSPCWAGDAGPWVVLYASAGRTYGITVTAVCRSDAERQARRPVGRWILIFEAFPV